MSLGEADPDPGSAGRLHHLTGGVLYLLQPKGHRFTTTKAPLNMAINIEELESVSESEEEDEWCPEKNERGCNRKNSNVNKPKSTGVRTLFCETGNTVGLEMVRSLLSLHLQC